jgi:hypothetical protein
MCCSSKRSVLRGTSMPPRVPESTSPMPKSVSGRGNVSSSGSAMASIKYTQASAIRVWGPVTGQPYDFASGQYAVAVDARDAAVLIRSNVFRRA